VAVWLCLLAWLLHTHTHTLTVGNISLLPQHQMAAYVAYEWHFDHFIWLLINATLINFSVPQRAPSPSGNVKLFVTCARWDLYAQLPLSITYVLFFFFADCYIMPRGLGAWNNKLLASRRLCLLSLKCTISWCFCGANALMPRPPHAHIPAKAAISDQL